MEVRERFLLRGGGTRRQKHTFFTPGLFFLSMAQKLHPSTRRFYIASRKNFNIELIPRKLLQDVAKDADGDQAYPKLPFDVFVDFMPRAILSVPNKPSTRRLARMSEHPSIQQVSGISGVSHQALADRLRSIHLPSLYHVFQEVSQGACRLLGRGFRRRGPHSHQWLT